MFDKPELQLITESRNGDREAMAELFRRHYPLSINVARRLLPARDDYSDAVQSAFLSALRNFTSFRGDSSFRSWIKRIVINQSLMQVRESVRRKRLVSLDDAVLGLAPVVVRDTGPTPEDLMQRAELRRTLVDAAAGLPRPLREAFDLYATSGRSIAETAKALGLTVAAAKTRVFRARSFMRSAINTHGDRKTAPVNKATCSPTVLKKAS